MKKFFAAVLVATALLLCQNPAQAVDVRLCDSDVESVISILQRAGNKLGIDIWDYEVTESTMDIYLYAVKIACKL